MVSVTSIIVVIMISREHFATAEVPRSREERSGGKGVSWLGRKGVGGEAQALVLLGGSDERRTRGAVWPAVAGHWSCGVSGNFLLPRLSLYLLFAWLQSIQADELRLGGENPIKKIKTAICTTFRTCA